MKTITRSFAGGEIAPELYGRLDLTKHQTGLALAKNFQILPHGPAQNRAGFEYVIETRDSTKQSVLLPFTYSTEQTYVIEFGDQYVRWHTQGGTLLETGLTITAITKANPGVLTYTGTDPSNGDWMYLSGIGGMTELNGRYVKVANVNAGANTFQLTDIHGGANINTTAFTTFTAGGTAARVYTLASPYLEADLFALHFTQSADVLTITHPSYAVRELRRSGATSWAFTTPSFVPTISAPAAPTLATGGPGGGTPITHTYVCTAVAADGQEESIASASANASRDLTVVGNYIDVDPPAVATAVRYNIYKLSNGLYGYIGQTEGSAFRDTNYTPDTTQTPPELYDPFPSAGNYPAAVGYFEGRRWFAGTTNKPQNLYGTRSGTENNMSYSIPTRDDDSISIRIAAREANTIRHIVPLGDLLLLTSGAEWRITAENSDVLSPTTISFRPQSYVGASNAQPVTTKVAVLYGAARGARIHEIRYSWDQQGYVPNDVSVMAPHLFDFEYAITQLAFQKSPTPILWAVRNDGVLLGMTYLPEHQVTAWWQVETDGEVESVAVVAEGIEDAVYVVVKRTINARTVRYIERLHSRHFADLEDAFFVDSGATYDGAAVTTISHGLWHLEGETVSALIDGAVHPQLVVTNGAVTLEQGASKVHIGLPYTADLQTLPLATESMPAFGQGAKKNINAVDLRVHRSSGIFAGPAFDKLTPYKQRTSEPYGSPPALKTGIAAISVTPSWGDEGQLCVRQTDPLPLTILSFTLDVTAGG